MRLSVRQVTLAIVALCLSVHVSVSKRVTQGGGGDVALDVAGAEPFTYAELNAANAMAHAAMKQGAGADKGRRTSFSKLMKLLHPAKDGPIDLVKALKYFRAAEPLFSVPAVSAGSWEYAWKHLPSILMDHPEMHFVIHTPASPYEPQDPKRGVFVFAGWDSEGGAFIDEAQCEENGRCILHVNTRDIATDIDEFLSNLLLHMQFLEENPEATVEACYDLPKRSESCRGWDKCRLSIKGLGECQGISFKAPVRPTYTVEVKGASQGIKAVVRVIEDQWKGWAKRLKAKAATLAKCDVEKLKVHVIQGATEAVWVMTSKHAMRNHSVGQLQGSYGGKFEAVDRKYAQLMSNFKVNISHMDELNGENSGEHVYDGMDGPFSVNTEIIRLEGWKAGEVDPVITEELLSDTLESRQCAVLLSVGYAFGTSALPMGLALKDTFGDMLKSFYVVGKAGGLVGAVGDYQIPSSFVLWKDLDQETAEVYRVDVSSVDFSLWSGGGERAIHESALLTVPSVVLQGNSMLDRAKEDPWKAAGLEMESYWFKQALSDVPGIYMYYTSDIPQASESSLAHESFPRNEGQTLFNGLVRMSFLHMLGLMKPAAISTTPTTTASRTTPTTTASSTTPTTTASSMTPMTTASSTTPTTAVSSTTPTTTASSRTPAPTAESSTTPNSAKTSTTTTSGSARQCGQGVPLALALLAALLGAARTPAGGR